MRYLKIERVLALVLLLSIAGLSSTAVPASRASVLDSSQTLPSGCESLQVEAGNELAFRVYAMGVQVYSWNGSSWTFVEPRATLFADARYHGEVGLTMLAQPGKVTVAAKLSLRVFQAQDALPIRVPLRG